MPPDEKEMPFPGDAEPPGSELRAFAPAQMVKCEDCQRANPPTRSGCLYCGAQLKATGESADLQRPTLRRLETWEQGFNIIFTPDASAQVTPEVLLEAAILLRLNQDELRNIFNAHVPLPLARAANEEEASLAKRKLAELGLGVIVVGDNELLPGAAGQRRARRFELTESELVAHSSGGGAPWRVAWEDVMLLVVGRLLTRRIEVEERKRRKTESEILNARETTADEAVLDIYPTQRDGNWRVSSRSFDFSCLGARKSLLAAENFSTLVEVLRTRAVRAAYDDSYNGVRRALAIAWPLEQKTEARGWNRSRPGRVSTEAMTTSDNETQFTRYSRLRYYLKLRQTDI